MVKRIDSCGKEMFSVESMGKDWRWVTLELKEPEGEADSLSKGKPYICGQLTDKGVLILLCPSCLTVAGRQW